MSNRWFRALTLAFLFLFSAIACCGTKPVPTAPVPVVFELPVTVYAEPLFSPSTGRFVPTLWLNHQFTHVFTAAALVRLNELKAAGAQELVVVINSPGGYCDDGYKLADAIEHSGIPTHCVVYGEASSMAFYVLQSCTTRHMTEGARLMTHEPLYIDTIAGNRDDLEKLISSLATTNEKMTTYEARRMKISVAELRDRIRHSDWRMDQDVALKVGAVDSVVNFNTYLKDLRK